jgi:hypothetical protein
VALTNIKEAGQLMAIIRFYETIKLLGSTEVIWPIDLLVFGKKKNDCVSNKIMYNLKVE